MSFKSGVQYHRQSDQLNHDQLSDLIL